VAFRNPLAMDNSPKTATAERPILATAVPPRRFQFRLIHLIVLTGLIGAALAVLVPMVRVARREAMQIRSRNNLMQIGLALHNYNDVYGAFPPAYQCDAAGKPVHSWRVLILPFMEQIPLHQGYNFAEPWDGPNNRRLSPAAPSVFRSPFDNSRPPGETSYVAIVGPGTMWPDDKSRKIAEVTDGTSNTIMVVELLNSGIHWMEPRDLPVEDLAAVWRDPKHKPPRMDGWETSYAFVLYADGSVHWLDREATLERLQALASTAGGEPPQRHER
jgi:type II secretory pathway pseudopilin PulG